MMILFLIITAALTLYAAFNIIAPFFQSRDDQLRFEVLDEDLRAIEELVARRSYLLKSLRELQLDHETGKISDEDFEETRKKLELEAVKVLREIDEIHGGRGWQDAIDAELDARLDGIRRRADAPADEETPEDTSTDIEDDASADDAESADTIECPECGKELEADARFCSQCGHAFHSDSDSDDEERDDETSGSSDEQDDSASVDEMLSEPQKADMNETSAEVAR